jgi:NitT/TauT family transport system permease protein
MPEQTGRLSSRAAPHLVGLAALAALVGLLEILVRAGAISRFVVPPPSEIAVSFEVLIVEEDLIHRFLTTAGEALVATLLVVAVGGPLGWLLYRFRPLKDAYETWVAGIASAPLILLYPLFLVLFGRNAFTIVMMGFVAGLAPMILKTREGLSSTRAILIDVGRSFKLTPAQQFWKITFPAAVPTIFTGLRLGLIFSLINIVGVEFLVNFGGLGQIIVELSERFDLPGMYGAICFVILVSVFLFVATEKVERWLRPV